MWIRECCPPVPSIWACRMGGTYCSNHCFTHPWTPTMTEVSFSFLWPPTLLRQLFPSSVAIIWKLPYYFTFTFGSVIFIPYVKHLEHIISIMVIYILVILIECGRKMKFMSSAAVLFSVLSWTSCISITRKLAANGNFGVPNQTYWIWNSGPQDSMLQQVPQVSLMQVKIWKAPLYHTTAFFYTHII